MSTAALGHGHSQAGSSLLEVLVAVVVLSIGLLGLAGLQMTSIKSSHSAYMRSQATLLAYDLADRARATRVLTQAGRLDDGSTDDERESWNLRVTQTLGADAAARFRREGERALILIYWNDSRGTVAPAEAPVRDAACDVGATEDGVPFAGFNCFAYATGI